MCSHDDETEQETLTDDEVKELYKEHPFVILMLKGGPKHKNKRLRKRYTLLVLEKKFKKRDLRRRSANPTKKASLRQRQRKKEKKLETYKKFSWLRKK